MFTLTTDTSCDVFRNELDAAGIPWVPLTFTVDGETHPDDFTADEQYKEFYAKVRAGVMPTTSQITAFAHEEFFRKCVENGAKDIVHISLSGGLSNTYAAACQAAAAVMEQKAGVTIEVVDSLGATQVHRMVLDDAIALRDAGAGAATAAEILRENAKKIHVLFAVDDLKHLRRGGRVSGAAAAIGTLLKIKPIISFDRAGGLYVEHKAKGFRKAMEHIVSYMEKWASDTSVVYMAHADALPWAQEATEILRERFGSQVRLGWCGPVIGAHTGGGMVGVIFRSDKYRPQ